MTTSTIVIALLGATLGLLAVRSTIRILSSTGEKLQREVQQYFARSSEGEARLTTTLSSIIPTINDSVRRSVAEISSSHELRLETLDQRIASDGREAERRLNHLVVGVGQRLDKGVEQVDQRIVRAFEQTSEEQRAHREEIQLVLKAQSDSVVRVLTDLGALQSRDLGAFSSQLAGLQSMVSERLEDVRGVVDQRLTEIRKDNDEQIEKMRATVDEKLQATLEQRLGQSFQTVASTLELVQRGLGDVQSLATGVGELRRILSNARSRGTWGEVQLGSLLEDFLAPDQYKANVALGGDEGTRVEFAIRLPGQSLESAEPVWLPIDSKFPLEDYQRLCDAEQDDPQAVSEAAKLFEAAVRTAAKTIAAKYLNPPITTDFAVMFLATEGLYAEVARRPGLVDEMQRLNRVVVAGPATLVALLSSLRMGFRCLAIQKRTSEVWDLLGAVKTEFAKFSGTLEKVRQKLNQASTTMDEAARRSRAIERSLRDVEFVTVEGAVGSVMEGTAEDEPHVEERQDV